MRISVQPSVRKKRVILLTQWFEPEPTFKGLLFARELKRRGFDVEVVTGFPNYPEGRLYPGWRMSLCKREVVEDVEVTRLPLYPSHDTSPIRRAATYLSFALSAAFYCLFVARRPDVVYVYQLPTLGLTAGLMQMVRRSRMVFDVQDIWPDALRLTGMMPNPRLSSLIAAATRWVYRRASVVVVLSPGFRRLLLERGVPPERVELIYNWCDEASVRDASPAPDFPRAGTFRILFAGNMGKAQALGAVLGAAELLLRSHPQITFVLLGNGVERDALIAEVARRGLRNVVFLPRVDMSRVGGYLQAADALLVHLKAEPSFEAWIPGKTQAYMAAGKPIIMAVAGDAGALVREAGAGVQATPGDPGSIANAAIKLATLDPEQRAEMGRRASDFYNRHLSMQVGTEKFVNLFNRIVTE